MEGGEARSVPRGAAHHGGDEAYGIFQHRMVLCSRTFGKLWVKYGGIHPLYSQPSPRLSNACGSPQGPGVQPLPLWSHHTAIDSQKNNFYFLDMLFQELCLGVHGCPAKGSVNFNGKKNPNDTFHFLSDT